MSIQHTARTGKTYYLHVGQGKGGKPNYFFFTEEEGPLADCLPPGFEIYENINGQVFLRRKLPRLITEEEMARVKEALKRHAEEWRYKVKVKKGLTFDEVVESMMLRANKLNFKYVGNNLMWKDFRAVLGDMDAPRVEVHSFCDIAVGRDLLKISVLYLPLLFTALMLCAVAKH